MTNAYLKSLFTKEISYETDIPLIRKQLLLSKLLLITIVIFTLLAVYHFFLSNDNAIVIVDAIALVSLLMASVSLHKYDNFNSAVTISTLTIFIFITMFTLINKNSDYGLIWTIFFPLFSILTMGHKKGIVFVAVFYAIIFYLAYLGVGDWQHGEWDMTSFFHFSLASSVLTYTIYSIEISQEDVHRELKIVHDKEQEYMDELERLSITDPLTKLHNRRYLERVFKGEFYRAKRHNLYLAFFILDIDFFKQYNDTYGHKEGDDVLVNVSSIMKAHFKRHEDYIFRLGGEEFGGLITSENESNLIDFIEQLCIKIADAKIEHTGNVNQPILTVSIGIKVIKNFNNDDFDLLYKHSDLALYEAKESGRNRAILYKGES